jgi:hypothetical protein
MLGDGQLGLKELEVYDYDVDEAIYDAIISFVGFLLEIYGSIKVNSYI